MVKHKDQNIHTIFPNINNDIYPLGQILKAVTLAVEKWTIPNKQYKRKAVPFRFRRGGSLEKLR